MIDEQAFLDIIDQLRVTVPEELKQARRFTQERDRVMQQAEVGKLCAHCLSQGSSSGTTSDERFLVNVVVEDL